MRFKNLKVATATFAAVCSVSVSAMAYPDGPVTLVAPYGAGGASDLCARSLAEAAKESLGQPIVVVNKKGNGGMLGARYVSQSKPDGNTLLLARVGMALYPAVNAASPVQWDSYTFLGSLESTPMIMAVKSDSPYKTAADLVKALKDNPGRMTYAASGPTAIDGFSTQAFLSDNGMDPLTAATLIPYKGGSALSTALLGGHVDFLAIAAGSLMPHIKGGKMRPLMVFAPKRMKQLPDVPTATELGYKQAGQITGWSALYAPKGLPKDVVAKWKDVLKDVAVSKTWLDLADKRGSISTVGEFDQAAYSKAQYDLFKGMAVKFGYVK